MHRLGIARPHADHSVRRRVVVQHVAPHLVGHVAHRPLKAPQPRAIPVGEAVFVLVQEVEHPAVHPRIHRRLDLENVERLVNQLAHPVRRTMQRRARRVHVRVRIAQRPDVVVMPQALVRRESHRDRLVPAVHRHQVDVQIDEQVGLGGAPRQPYFLAMLGLAEHRQLGAIFRVEVVQPVRPILLERALANDAADFGFGHAAMQRRRDHQMHIVNAVIGKRLQHLVEQPLADVGPAHLRQRQTDVVNRDRHAHVGTQLREQRVLVLGMKERVANRLVGVGQRVQRRRRIDHARADRQLLEQKFLAIRDDAALRAPIQLDDQLAARTDFMAQLGGFEFLEFSFRPRHPSLASIVRCPVEGPGRRRNRQAALKTRPSRNGSPAIAG